MTRRQFFSAALAVGVAPNIPQSKLILPVRHVLDQRAKLRAGQLSGFTSGIWAEAVRDFERCGIRIESSGGTGEIRRTASGKPIFTGLDHGVINLVLTNHVPMDWDKGRALRGVTTRYDGYHICVIALDLAHGHQVPFLSVNTCVHELLHVLLQDIFEKRPKGLPGNMRELRIDAYATRLWLFHDGAEIREAAQSYMRRLQHS